MGPPGDAILTAYFLEHGGADAKLLRHFIDGEVEILCQLLEGNSRRGRDVRSGGGRGSHGAKNHYRGRGEREWEGMCLGAAADVKDRSLSG